MDERDVLERKILLKRQAAKIIETECIELEFRLSLLRVRDVLLEKIKSGFNRELSRELECVDFLLGSTMEKNNEVQ